MWRGGGIPAGPRRCDLSGHCIAYRIPHADSARGILYIKCPRRKAGVGYSVSAVDLNALFGVEQLDEGDAGIEEDIVPVVIVIIIVSLVSASGDIGYIRRTAGAIIRP